MEIHNSALQNLPKVRRIFCCCQLKQLINCYSTTRAFVEQSFCLEYCSIYWKWRHSQRLIGLYNLKMKFKVCADACTFKQLESQVVALKNNNQFVAHTLHMWRNQSHGVKCQCQLHRQSIQYMLDKFQLLLNLNQNYVQVSKSLLSTSERICSSYKLWVMDVPENLLQSITNSLTVLLRWWQIFVQIFKSVYEGISKHNSNRNYRNWLLAAQTLLTGNLEMAWNSEAFRHEKCRDNIKLLRIPALEDNNIWCCCIRM